MFITAIIHRMRGWLLRLAGLSILVLTVALPWPGAAAHAQDRSIRVQAIKSTTPNGKPAAALIVNDIVVAQLAKEQRSRSPLLNISVAAALITQAYRANRAELSVKATDGTDRRFALFLNGDVLLVSTDMEGKAWGTTPKELALTWQNNLLDAWDMAETVPLPEPVNPVRASVPIVASPAPVVETPAPLVETPVPVVPAAPAGGTLVQQTVIVADPQLAKLKITNGHKVYDPPAHTRLTGNAIGDVKQAQALMESRRLSLPREGLTFFSNKPEQVAEPQLLYHAELPGRESARLVLHHQNKSRAALWLVARVLNPSHEATAIHVIPGICAPDINTFYIGFKSAEQFWHNLNTGTGYVLGVPAGGQAQILVQELPSGYTSSGYFKISNLADIPLRVETLVLATGQALPAAPMGNAAESSQGVYGPPYETFTATYEAGDPWLYLRLGEANPPSLTDGSVLDGCYGMTHSYNVELHNSKEWPALVFVVLRASAGEVKGQFFIDDEYVATPLVISGGEQLLKEIPIKPGETKLLKIKAIPLNGGFYPASVILRESRYP